MGLSAVRAEARRARGFESSAPANDGTADSVMFMRFLFATIVGLLAALAPSDAMACSRGDEWTRQSDFDRAKAVFRATVTKAELSDYIPPKPYHQGRHLVFVYYDLKEVLKGDPTDHGPVSTTNLYFGGCGLPVAVGMDFIFFVDHYSERVPDEARGDSRGQINFFSSWRVPENDELAQEVMAELRAYRGPDPEKPKAGDVKP
jgi:hypothetical protein